MYRRSDPGRIRLRGHDEGEFPGEMGSGAVEGVEDRGTRRARCLGERQPGRLAPRGPRPGVARPAREHEAVDDERILARRGQLRELDLATPIRRLEDTSPPGTAPPSGSARRCAATRSIIRRSSISASSSRLRARRYSSDSPGNRMAGSTDMWCSLVTPGWRHAVTAARADGLSRRFMTRPRAVR